MTDRPLDWITHATRAGELVDSPTLALAMERGQRACFDEWLATDVSDKETREALYHRARAISVVAEALLEMYNWQAGNEYPKPEEVTVG